MILDSPEPLARLGQGRQAFFFNDAYLPLLGGNGAMGNRLEDVWADVWPDVAQAVNDAFAGTSRSFKNLPLMMDRDGSMRETFWTFSYSPLRVGCGSGRHPVRGERADRTGDRARPAQPAGRGDHRAGAGSPPGTGTRPRACASRRSWRRSASTGGVAHDFNNLLQVITGSVDMLLHTWPADDNRRRYIQAIAAASDRATKLTAQLPAFSRRQSLSPEVFDLCESARSRISSPRFWARASRYRCRCPVRRCRCCWTGPNSTPH